MKKLEIEINKFVLRLEKNKISSVIDNLPNYYNRKKERKVKYDNDNYPVMLKVISIINSKCEFYITDIEILNFELINDKLKLNTIIYY